MSRAHSIPANQRIALSLSDAAAALDVSLDTLNAWIRAGAIPETRLVTTAGKPLPRIMWDDLMAFCLKNRDPYPLPTTLRKRGAA